jgi:hypothetical protein
VAHDLLILAEAGNSCALKALDKTALAIGRAMRMVIADLSPEQIVVV